MLLKLKSDYVGKIFKQLLIELVIIGSPIKGIRQGPEVNIVTNIPKSLQFLLAWFLLNGFLIKNVLVLTRIMSKLPFHCFPTVLSNQKPFSKVISMRRSLQVVKYLQIASNVPNY